MLADSGAADDELCQRKRSSGQLEALHGRLSESVLKNMLKRAESCKPCELLGTAPHL